MKFLFLLFLTPILCFASFSTGFRWDVNSWGFAARYILPNYYYINGNLVFGARSKNNDEYFAYSVGIGAGKLFNVCDNVMPLCGISLGTGTVKDYYSTRDNYADSVRTTDIGGRIFLGMAIVILKGFGEVRDTEMSGLTLELETGFSYKSNYKYRAYYHGPYQDEYEHTDIKGFLPDFGIALYYNW